MGDDQQVYGNVTTNCQLNAVGTPSLGSGKWVSGPSTQINPPTTPGPVAFFEASGKEDSAVGTNGQLSYQGPDGTVFNFVFSDPYGGDNNCTLAVTSGTPANYNYSTTFNQGDVCNFNSTITYNSQQVYGSVTTNCELNLVGTPSLSNGQWVSGPVNQIMPSSPPSPAAFFEASGPDVAGQLTYSGPDGTQFIFAFSDPAGGTTNNCTLSVAPGGTPSNYTFSSTFNQGDVCNFDSTITYNAS
ncbi:MAG TPA: hypothetical protein VOA87_04980 [Thermoanaerobaculia bacterium]|nr:hypothetical protein [Thermoanaerobaculia bacterium]